MSTNIKALTDAFTTKINNVDFVDATHINALQQVVKQLAAATLTQEGFMNYELLPATRQLTNDDLIYQVYCLNGSNQTVLLPAVGDETHPFLIWNYDQGTSIIVQNSAGVTLQTLVPKDYVLLVPLAGEWLSFKKGFDPTFTIQFVIGDGLLPIVAGTKLDIEVPYNCEVIGWTIVETTGLTGECVIGVWRDIYANYPPTYDDSIAGNERVWLPPGVTKFQNNGLGSWTRRLNAREILRFHVDSSTTVKQVTVSLWCKRV